MRKRRIRTALLVVIVLLLVTQVVAAAGNPNPGVVPPHVRVQEMSYAEWSAKWWQVLMAIPVPENARTGPFGDPCFFRRVGDVGLAVGGTGTGGIACTMPIGTKLFLPILSAECSTLEDPPFHGDNVRELRECALSWAPADLQATIDGAPLQNLQDYVVISPVYGIVLPPNNIWGIDPGVGMSVSYGAWLMLMPLTSGKHMITLHGIFPADNSVWDWYYDITVEPAH